jgi:hypothetical protein
MCNLRIVSSSEFGFKICISEWARCEEALRCRGLPYLMPSLDRPPVVIALSLSKFVVKIRTVGKAFHKLG